MKTIELKPGQIIIDTENNKYEVEEGDKLIESTEYEVLFKRIGKISFYPFGKKDGGYNYQSQEGMLYRNRCFDVIFFGSGARCYNFNQEIFIFSFTKAKVKPLLDGLSQMTEEFDLQKGFEVSINEDTGKKLERAFYNLRDKVKF